MRKCWLLIALSFSLTTVFASGAAAFTPEAVVATARVETGPAAADGYLAYTRDTATNPNRADLIVQHAPDPDFRVNPPGTVAAGWSIDGTTLSFSQRPITGGRSDIHLFDLVAKVTSDPAGVNTARHESQAYLSGDWLLFARSRRVSFNSPRRILLRNLDTTEQRELDLGGPAYVQNGGLAGNYAVWTRCPRLRRCQTWRYDITAETATRLPNPLDRSQFAASVTADGTVYYAESRTILCSTTKRVRFYRQPLAGPRELLAILPRGKDTGQTSPVVLTGGDVEVYFDRFNGTCAKSDIYKVVIPAGP